jgi:hypothetical protein
MAVSPKSLEGFQTLELPSSAWPATPPLEGAAESSAPSLCPAQCSISQPPCHPTVLPGDPPRRVGLLELQPKLRPHHQFPFCPSCLRSVTGSRICHPNLLTQTLLIVNKFPR